MPLRIPSSKAVWEYLDRTLTAPDLDELIEEIQHDTYIFPEVVRASQ